MKFSTEAELDALATAVARELVKLTEDEVALVFKVAVKHGGQLSIEDIAMMPGWSLAKAHAVGFVLHKAGQIG